MLNIYSSLCIEHWETLETIIIDKQSDLSAWWDFTQYDDPMAQVCFHYTAQNIL